MMKSRLHFHIDKDLLLAILVGVGGSLVALIMFFLSGYMVTQSALGAPLYALMILVVSVKLFGFLRAIARYAERLLSHKTTFTMLRNIRVQFFHQLVDVVPNIYRRFSSSDLISRMINRVEALQNIYLRVYYPPLVIGFTALITIVALLFISPLHALLIGISMVLTLYIVPWISAKRARVLKQEVARQQRSFLLNFYDYKEGQEELQRFDKEAVFREKTEQALKQHDIMQLKEQRFLSTYDLILNIIAMLSIFGSLYLGYIQIAQRHLDIVYLTSIVLMILTLFEQAVPMTNVAYYKADTDQSLEEINSVLQTPRTNGEEVMHSSHNTLTYSLNHVNFKYYNQESYVLKDITLDINQGEKVAIVGPSGSGKSTLLQLLLGLYHTDQGQVLFNKQEIVNIKDEDKFKEINSLLQAQQLFDGTIRENLFTNKKDDEIYSIFERLNLSHLSLDQRIDLQGSNLSGGEIQRLSLARLFLKENAEVWLLDEPTTALDQENTERVMAMLKEAATTLIVATHDLNLLSRFDKIIVMVEGTIVEMGDYQTLLRQRGILSDMMNY